MNNNELTAKISDSISDKLIYSNAFNHEWIFVNVECRDSIDELMNEIGHSPFPLK